VQLFNASAVVEARTAVTQGRNIRILTLISLLFLPASFVASIFGMQTILPPSVSLHTFAIAISLICGPTYLFILALDARTKGMHRKKFCSGQEKARYFNVWNWLRDKKLIIMSRRKGRDVEKGN